MEKLAEQVATHASGHIFLPAHLGIAEKPLSFEDFSLPSVRVRKSFCVGPLQVLASYHSADVSGVRGKLEGLVAARANTSDL